MLDFCTDYSPGVVRYSYNQLRLVMKSTGGDGIDAIASSSFHPLSGAKDGY